MNPPPFDAIIFDHDGTLIDTESPDFEACKLLFEDVGLLLSIEYWAKNAVGRVDGYYFLFHVKTHKKY